MFFSLHVCTFSIRKYVLSFLLKTRGFTCTPHETSRLRARSEARVPIVQLLNLKIYSPCNFEELFSIVYYIIPPKSLLFKFFTHDSFVQRSVRYKTNGTFEAIFFSENITCPRYFFSVNSTFNRIFCTIFDIQIKLWRYDKKRRLKYRRHFLSRVCSDVCRRRLYVSFRQKSYEYNTPHLQTRLLNACAHAHG